MKIRPRIHTEVTPLVSIVCLTFNQAKFIAQTIDGFIAQQTNFPFEVIIHDDASTDETLSIVNGYQARYPELITVITQSKNVYSTGIRVPALVFSHARGKFIAYCEGDDFWCNPHKIQMQADLLLNNPKCGAVFTGKNLLLEESGRLILGNVKFDKKNIPRGDVRAALLEANPYTTCTSMFRTDAITGYETVAKKLQARLDDYVMWLFIAGKYEIEYLDEVTATYRVCNVSASHSPLLAVKVKFYRSAYKIACHFNKVYGGVVNKTSLKNRYKTVLIEYCLNNGYLKQSFYYARPLRLYLTCVMRVLLRNALGRGH